MLCTQPALSIQSRHTTTACSGNSLTVNFILRIARTENAFHVGVACSWLGDDIPLVIHVDIGLEDIGVWCMTDCHKESFDWELHCLAAHIVLYTQTLNAKLAQNLIGFCVEQYLNVGCIHHAVLHGF